MSETVSTEIAQSGCKDNENSFTCKHAFCFIYLYVRCIDKKSAFGVGWLFFCVFLLYLCILKQLFYECFWKL